MSSDLKDLRYEKWVNAPKRKHQIACFKLIFNRVMQNSALPTMDMKICKLLEELEMFFYDERNYNERTVRIEGKGDKQFEHDYYKKKTKEMLDRKNLKEGSKLSFSEPIRGFEI